MCHCFEFLNIFAKQSRKIVEKSQKSGYHITRISDLIVVLTVVSIRNIYRALVPIFIIMFHNFGYYFSMIFVLFIGP